MKKNRYEKRQYTNSKTKGNNQFRSVPLTILFALPCFCCKFVCTRSTRSCTPPLLYQRVYVFFCLIFSYICCCWSVFPLVGSFFFLSSYSFLLFLCVRYCLFEFECNYLTVCHIHSFQWMSLKPYALRRDMSVVYVKEGKREKKNVQITLQFFVSSSFVEAVMMMIVVGSPLSTLFVLCYMVQFKTGCTRNIIINFFSLEISTHLSIFEAF